MDTISNSAALSQKVVPLLQSMARVEDNVSALALRLDPITAHEPTQNDKPPYQSTVTGRLQQLGDTLQYLLEHIEL